MDKNKLIKALAARVRSQRTELRRINRDKDRVREELWLKNRVLESELKSVNTAYDELMQKYLRQPAVERK